MDALQYLIKQVPEWQTRLDNLPSDIQQRQLELAQSAIISSSYSPARSLKNKSSTESLRPPHEYFSFNTASNRQATPELASSDLQWPTSMLSVPPLSHSLPSSVASTAPLQQDRHKRTVYYDSFVQDFFGDLVRYVSGGRNLMRRAKMAARVVQIKRMADVDRSMDTDSDDTLLASARYRAPIRFQACLHNRADSADGQQSTNIYDALDRHLDCIQSAAEGGAHQFLKDATCDREINSIQERFKTVIKLSLQEKERIEQEEPDLAIQHNDMGKIRTRRAISVRRDMSSPKGEYTASSTASPCSTAFTELDIGAIEIDADACRDSPLKYEQDATNLEYRTTSPLIRP